MNGSRRYQQSASLLEITQAKDQMLKSHYQATLLPTLEADQIEDS